MRWCMAVQETAVGVWVAYALSSMVTTRLAWGEWIAWDEPRVRASMHVLWFCIACLLLVKWMNNATFTAFTNIVVAGAVWFLIKGAGLLRHPFDPIGGSNSLQYQVLYLALVAAVLAFAAVAARWRYTRTKT
jgi:Na+/citrate or Na+/malate symporter